MSDVPSEFLEPEGENNLEFAAEMSKAFDIATWIMQEFEPGFVIIGSPDIGLSDAGVPFPDQIGIAVNHETGITKTALAEILGTIISNLNGDMDKIQAFLKEALNDTD